MSELIPILAYLSQNGESVTQYFAIDSLLLVTQGKDSVLAVVDNSIGQWWLTVSKE